MLPLSASERGGLSFEKQSFYREVLFADPVSSSKLKSDQEGGNFEMSHFAHALWRLEIQYLFRRRSGCSEHAPSRG